MRRLSWVVGLFCMLVWAASAADVNFAGTYGLDKEKSKLPQRAGGGGGGGGDQTWTIAQDAKAITVEAKMTFGQNERTVKSTYNLDGSETTTEQTTGRMTGKTATKGKWSDDKKSFETTSAFTGKRGDQDITRTTKDKWSLSDDGKVLTITRTTEGGTNNQESTLVLNKK